MCAHWHAGPPRHTCHTCYVASRSAGATVPVEAKRYVHALALVPACVCAPRGTCSAGATVPAKGAPAVGAGCSSLPAMAVPRAPIVHMEGKNERETRREGARRGENERGQVGERTRKRIGEKEEREREREDHANKLIIKCDAAPTEISPRTFIWMPSGSCRGLKHARIFK